MESNIVKRNQHRKKRALRVRKHLRGTAAKPRMSVLKTNKHLSVQLIDDEKGHTLCSIGTMTKGFTAQKRSKEAARQIGAKIAQLAKEKEVKTAVFDRGYLKFHGVIAELANAAREAGLQF